MAGEAAFELLSSSLAAAPGGRLTRLSRRRRWAGARAARKVRDMSSVRQTAFEGFFQNTSFIAWSNFSRMLCRCILQGEGAAAAQVRVHVACIEAVVDSISLQSARHYPASRPGNVNAGPQPTQSHLYPAVPWKPPASSAAPNMSSSMLRKQAAWAASSRGVQMQGAACSASSAAEQAGS
jgi:hypothetical protein